MQFDHSCHFVVKKDVVKEDVKEVKKASSHLAKDALSAAANVATKMLPKFPMIPSIPDVEVGIKNKVIEKITPEKKGSVNEPGIFFISGLSLISSSGEDGLKAMAESTEGAQHFSWDNEEMVIEEILKRPESQPIILVGHSLGGDSAVRIANRLNTLEFGFRDVSLLGTLDSVGFENDIIPSNVKKNINFISDEDYFFNDGPNIARDARKSEVLNFLRSETHREIDNQHDVQASIVENINEVLSESKVRDKFEQLRELYSLLK